MIKLVLHIKRDGDITKSIQSKDEQMGSMSWTTCHNAVDFRARLRFRGGSSVQRSHEKIRTSWILHQTRSDCPSTNILLFQTLF